jgi:hypothetical protein
MFFSARRFDREECELEDTPTREHRFDVLVHQHAASQYSRDYVFTCRLLEQVALEETRQKMLVLTEAGQSV